MEQESVELLKSIDKKLTQKKKDIWDLLGLISTFISTVIITLIGLYINQRSKTEEQSFQKEGRDKEAVFRKTELIEKFSPLLCTDDSIKNKVAILGMYTLDTSLALKLANMLNTSGTRSAVRALFNTVDSNSQSSIEKVLVSINNAMSDTVTTNKTDDISQKALKRAVNEIGVKEDSPQINDGIELKKYFEAVGMSSGTEWSAAFVVWCYLADSNIQRLAYMKTKSSLELYNSMNNQGLILEERVAPKPGDIVFFDITTPGKIDHSGIVYQYDNGLLYTVEGNVNLGDSSGRGKVMKRVRKLALVYGYGRVK